MCNKTTSFRRFAKGAFRKSLVTGFPQIAGAKPWPRRWLKGLVFALCAAGLLQQTSEFLGLYFSHPTVIAMEVTNPDTVQLPAFTVCNVNKRRRSVVCEKEECTCVNNTIAMCTLHPRYCPDFHINYKNDGYYLKIPDVEKCKEIPCLNMSWEQAREESPSLETIYSCGKTSMKMDNEPCRTPYKRTPAREIYHPYELNMCYTLESEVGNPEAEPVFHDTTLNIRLEFRTHGEDYFETKDFPSLLMAIHDPKAFVNPYDSGFVIQGGMRYNAFVSMTKKTFLPPPYDTKCIDYLEKWKENGGTGPLNKKSCIEFCKMKTLEEKGECMDHEIVYPHEKPVCGKGVIKVNEKIMKNCTLSCGNPCKEQIYTWKIEQASTFDCTYRERFENTCGHNKTVIEVIFSRYILTNIVYHPKYDSLSLFSYLGGFVGIWIGISLVSVFDLLETFFSLAVYAISRKKKARRIKVVNF